LWCCEDEFTTYNLEKMKDSKDLKPEAFKVTGNWADQSKALKSKFPQLTDANLKFEVRKENDLIKRVETRLNKKREEVINIIKKGQSNVG